MQSFNHFSANPLFVLWLDVRSTISDDKKQSAPKGDKWEGEDSDDNVKDNWDDEDEPVATGPEPEPPKVPQISQKKKKLQKIAEKERKEREERMDSKPKTPEEILAEKLERQRLQEESDLLLAKEAFGDGKAANNVLEMSLQTREDFDAFRKALVDKLLVYDKSVHYVNFLESLFRELCVSIESDDIKRLNGSLTALFNEKVKAQKVSMAYDTCCSLLTYIDLVLFVAQAVTKGKKKQKGVTVRVEKDDIGYGVGNNDYEDFDDFI